VGAHAGLVQAFRHGTDGLRRTALRSANSALNNSVTEQKYCQPWMADTGLVMT